MIVQRAVLQDGSTTKNFKDIDPKLIVRIVKSTWGSNWIDPNTLTDDCFVILGIPNSHFMGAAAKFNAKTREFESTFLMQTFKMESVDAIMVLEPPRIEIITP